MCICVCTSMHPYVYIYIYIYIYKRNRIWRLLKLLRPKASAAGGAIGRRGNVA